VFALAIAAWMSLAWLELSGSGSVHVHAHQLDPGSIDSAAAWVLMPLSRLGLRHAALSTFWSRRHRAVGLYLAGYLGVWVAAGALLMVGAFALASLTGWQLVTAGAFATAVGWQFTAAKRRALRRCDRRVSVPGDGWHADRASLGNGVVSGLACAANCWAIMAAVVAAHHAVPIMLALFAAQVQERRMWRYDPMPIAAWIAVVGGAAVLLP
jgi:predicted metal-binding membrane protein